MDLNMSDGLQESMDSMYQSFPPVYPFNARTFDQELSPIPSSWELDVRDFAKENEAWDVNRTRKSTEENEILYMRQFMANSSYNYESWHSPDLSKPDTRRHRTTECVSESSIINADTCNPPASFGNVLFGQQVPRRARIRELVPPITRKTLKKLESRSVLNNLALGVEPSFDHEFIYSRICRHGKAERSTATTYSDFLQSDICNRAYGSRSSVQNLNRQTRHTKGQQKVLPMLLRSPGRVSKTGTSEMVNILPDSGAHESGISLSMLRMLGLELEPLPPGSGYVSLANGKRLRALGQTYVHYRFVYGSPSTQVLRFNVFKTLATPILIGNRFLEQKKIFTKNKHRLRTVSAASSSIRKVMYLNHPSCGLDCTVGNQKVLATADTGADMNLVSPSFIKRQGLSWDDLQPEDKRVMFADGSIGAIKHSYRELLTVGQGRDQTSSWTTFYVLEGLEAEVLLGLDILEGLNAFERYEDQFSETPDSEDIQLDFSLCYIKWFSKMEQQLLKVFGRNKTSARTASPSSLPDATLPPHQFRAALAVSDAFEDYLRERSDKYIAGLGGPERDAAPAIEIKRRADHDKARNDRIARHEQNHAPPVSSGQSSSQQVLMNVIP